MNKTLLIITLFLITSCVGNLQREPEIWVTLIDSENNKPVPNVSLVYYVFRKPYFIVTSVHESREYKSNDKGKVQIPKGGGMHVHPSYEYEIDHSKNAERIIYIKKITKTEP